MQIELRHEPARERDRHRREAHFDREHPAARIRCARDLGERAGDGLAGVRIHANLRRIAELQLHDLTIRQAQRERRSRDRACP